MDFFEEWEEASWHFTYGDEDQPEKTVLQGGLVIVLYMVKSYLQGNRIALADTMLRLQQIMGEHLQWGYWEHPNKEKKYTRERFAQCVEWVRVPKLRGLHMGSAMSETRFNDELTGRWLRRFDEPDSRAQLQNRKTIL